MDCFPVFDNIITPITWLFKNYDTDSNEILSSDLQNPFVLVDSDDPSLQKLEPIKHRNDYNDECYDPPIKTSPDEKGTRTILCDIEVPYHRRGLSLKQLKSLRAGLSDTDWLPSYCHRFNNADTKQHVPENREPINTTKNKPIEKKKKKKKKKEPNFYTLNEAFVKEVTRHTNNKTKHQQQQEQHSDSNHCNTIPQKVLEATGLGADNTNVPPPSDCSIAQLLNKEGNTVDYFVSHCWEHDFERTIRALERFAHSVHSKIGKKSPDDVVFWLCAFALNQQELSRTTMCSTTPPDQDPFHLALKNAKHGSVMVLLDGDAKPMKRLWCLYEVSRAKELGKRLDLVVDQGCVANASTATLEEICEKLLRVRASDAKATRTSDERWIQYRILDERWKKEFSTFESYELQVRGNGNDDGERGGREGPDGNGGGGVQEFFFETFDQLVCSAIATPLMEAGLRAKSETVCLRALGMGATITLEDLKILHQRPGGVDLKDHKVETKRGGSCGLTNVLASSGRIDELCYVLDNVGANVNDEDIYGATALFEAAERGHVDICAMLLDRGATVGKKTDTGYTALHVAAEGGNSELCALFLEHGAEVDEIEGMGNSPIQLAAMRGHVRACQVLLDHGDGPTVVNKNGDGFNALHLGAQSGRSEVCALLLERGRDVDVGARTNRGSTALLLAAQNGHVETYSLLLEHGADVFARNDRGFGSLHLAAENGHVDMCTRLFDGGGGAEVSMGEIVAAFINERNNTGHTALLLAAQNGHLATYKVLLAHGANPCDRTNSGSTSLHLAAENGRVDMCQLLLENNSNNNNGVKVRSKRNNGMTSLHSAAMRGHTDVCTFLLNHGADIHEEDHMGRTALHVADQYGHMKLYTLLRFFASGCVEDEMMELDSLS